MKTLAFPNNLPLSMFAVFIVHEFKYSPVYLFKGCSIEGTELYQDSSLIQSPASLTS